MKCVVCNKETSKYVCDSCYKDPDTNNCQICGKHLEGIQYSYDCGDCVYKRLNRKDSVMTKLATVEFDIEEQNWKNEEQLEVVKAVCEEYKKNFEEMFEEFLRFSKDNDLHFSIKFKEISGDTRQAEITFGENQILRIDPPWESSNC